MVIAVANISPNQFGIPYPALYLWSALKQKVPLALNLGVHLFLFCNHQAGMDQEENILNVLAMLS